MLKKRSANSMQQKNIFQIEPSSNVGTTCHDATRRIGVRMHNMCSKQKRTKDRMKGKCRGFAWLQKSKAIIVKYMCNMVMFYGHDQRKMIER